MYICTINISVLYIYNCTIYITVLNLNLYTSDCHTIIHLPLITKQTILTNYNDWIYLMNALRYIKLSDFNEIKTIYNV